MQTREFRSSIRNAIRPNSKISNFDLHHNKAKLENFDLRKNKAKL